MKLNIRGQDAQGSGEWLASRGNRFHKGEDVVCYAGDRILSHTDGFVSKIGYPYNPSNEKKGHLRYVEITDSEKSKIRYFYIKATVERGQKVVKNEQIGISQDLTQIYPGITQHYHLEIIAYVQPTKYLKLT